MTTNRLATRREAAEFLRCSERQIDRMARDGRLRPHRLGIRGVRFWTRDLEGLISG
jgi:excisionase family DNA binding protein